MPPGSSPTACGDSTWKRTDERRIIFALDRKIHNTLFAITDSVTGIRREAHIRKLLAGEIVFHVVHSNFFPRAKNDTEFPFAGDAGIFERTKAVQRHDSRPLIVTDSPAISMIIIDHHRKRIRIPTFPSRNYVYMRHNYGIFFPFSIFSMSCIISDIFCLQPIAFRQFHHGINCAGGLFTIRIISVTLPAYRGNGNYFAEIVQNIVPIIKNVFTKQHIDKSFLNQ